jgi:tetratricopeptide (TPR) repeat protein
MNILQEKLASSIQLRESYKHKEARQILLALHADFPDDPQVSYQCGWIHDLLGLGSTFRCIGEYQKSIETFRHALTLFPDSHKFNVFLGIADYNTGEYSKAMELLLNGLADTSSHEGILRYRRAIRFYSDKLDQTW